MGQETSASLTVDSAAASNNVSVVRGIRRLLVTAAIAALVCTWTIVASKGGCFTDAGVCYDMRLSVSPLVFVALAAVVLVALNRIISRNLDPFEASRLLDRAGLVVKIGALVAIVVAQAWFWATPVDDFVLHGGALFSPFPFGAIEVSITPASP